MIDYTKIHVLLADGKDRQVLPMSRALKSLGCTVTTINGSRLDNGWSSRYPDHRILDRSVKKSPENLLRAIESALVTGKYDLVITTTDPTAELLSLNKERLERYAKIAVVEPELFYAAYDKLNTMKICMENGIPCPKTLFGVKTPDDIISSGLGFPIILKPRKSFGSIGFRRIESSEELLEYCLENKIDLSECIVQEYIPQYDIQYIVSVFVDNEHHIKSLVVSSKNRWYPTDGGTSTLNITVDRPDIVESCSRLLELMGWRGCADIDLIQDPRDGAAKIMEINARPSGCVKICYEAGVDLTRQMIEAAFGEPVTDYTDYKKGVRLRCLLTDILWFIESENRFKARPSWFSMKNTKDQIFSLHDPLPGITYCIQAVLIYREEMAKRRRRY